MEEDPACPTLLHLAVEQNFAHVTKLLVEKYPSLVYTKTQPAGGNIEYLPVEKALMLYNDDTAAYLISQMKPDRWEKLVLCSLFGWFFDTFLRCEARRTVFLIPHISLHFNKELLTSWFNNMKSRTSEISTFYLPLGWMSLT